MRKNAAMRVGAGEHAYSAAALIPMAVVAAGVLVLALLASGSPPGTIVVQSFAERYSAAATSGPKRISITTVTQTSGSGVLERIFFSVSFNRGSEAVNSHRSMERYVAADNTVYEFSASKFDAAELRLTGIRPARRPDLLAGYPGTSLAPGRISFFKRLLDRHVYRIAARIVFDGRPALKLVPLPGEGSLGLGARTGIHQLLGTAYVTPGSDDPIAESIRGFQHIDWTAYTVLPDTATNRRLLSLTARHPSARVSHSAIAYLRAIGYLRAVRRPRHP